MLAMDEMDAMEAPGSDFIQDANLSVAPPQKKPVTEVEATAEEEDELAAMMAL